MSQLCTWCGSQYESRSNGGSAQRFCSKDCRQDFNTACRVWVAQEYEAERVSIFTLRTCLGQHTRCVQGDPASEAPQGPETGVGTGGALEGAAPMVDVR